MAELAVKERTLPIFSFQPQKKRVVIVDSLQKLKNLRKQMMRLAEFAYDTETNTLRVYGPSKDFKLVGISISWGAFNNYYIPLGHVREEDVGRQLALETVVQFLKDPFEREDILITGRNLKFDMHVFSRVGIKIRTPYLFDTMIGSWLCDENTPNGLKEDSARLLGLSQEHFKDVLSTIPKEVKKLFGLKANSRPTFDLALIDDSANYAVDDAFNAWELYLGYLDLLEDEKMLKIYLKVYAPYIRTLYDMEERGVTVNTTRLQEMKVDIKKDIDQLLYDMYEIAGVEFNPGSSKQLGELLFGFQAEIPKPEESSDYRYLDQKIKDKLQKDYKKKVYEQEHSKLMPLSFHFPIAEKTPTGAPKTDGDTFYFLSKKQYATKRKQEGVKLCELLVQYKKLAKLNSAFIEGLETQIYDDGKVHPTFNIIGTISGRLSCQEPNLQQLPKAEEDDKYQIRSLFIGDIDPVTGKRKKIIACDYSNLEMRVLAHFSEDKHLITMFKNGDDAHGSTAVNMFELDCTPAEAKKQYPHLRQAAKTINFMLMYGGGAQALYLKLRDDIYSPIDLGSKEYLAQYAEYNVRNGIDVAQVYIDKYFSTYAGVAKFIKNQKRYAHQNGFVYTILRRKKRLPDINSSNFGKQSYSERLSVNGAIQGTAADITMNAQNRIKFDSDSWFTEHRVDMILQVHDEIVFDCPEEYVEEAIPRIQALMAHPFGDNVELNLPLQADCDSGDSYQEAK